MKAYLDETREDSRQEWLAQQHRRITAHREEQRRLRTAPDEVTHRRVDGQTVLSRRFRR